MIFEETKLPGALVIRAETLGDERGYFARAWCRKELEDHGLVTRIAQASISFNYKRGTLRGLHYQAAPMAETKIVRCTRGAIYDVVVDLRPNSETRDQWIGLELTADNYAMMYVPEGFAHGFQTLTDNTEVFYQISQFYSPDHGRGVRYDDPQFAITWPEPVTVISARDLNWPNYQQDPALREIK